MKSDSNSDRRGNIFVSGKMFLCEKDCDVQYSEPISLPMKPYKLERVIDEKSAYLVDSLGLVWILEEDNVFRKPCFRYCWFYVHDKDPEIKTFAEALEVLRLRK